MCSAWPIVGSRSVERFAGEQALRLPVAKPADAGDEPYVSLEDIAKDECRCGLSSTVDRSNYRPLHHEFPGRVDGAGLHQCHRAACLRCRPSAAVVDIVCGRDVITRRMTRWICRRWNTARSTARCATATASMPSSVGCDAESSLSTVACPFCSRRQCVVGVHDGAAAF